MTCSTLCWENGENLNSKVRTFSYAAVSLLFGCFIDRVAAQAWLDNYEKEAEPALFKAQEIRSPEIAKQFLTSNFNRFWNQLLPIAKSGDPVAQYYLARHYHLHSMMINLSSYEQEALRWVKQSSDQGYPPAHSLRMQLDRKLALVFDCLPTESNASDELCKQKITLVKKAVEGGYFEHVSLVAMLEAGKDNNLLMARLYVWKRLSLDFSAPSGWNGWRVFPAPLRDEMAAIRKEEEAQFSAINESVRSSHSDEKIKTLENECQERRSNLKRTILYWKERYPALRAGAHGWYEK